MKAKSFHTIGIATTIASLIVSFPSHAQSPSIIEVGMTIGQSFFRNPKHLTLYWLLVQSFIGNPGKYSFSR